MSKSKKNLHVPLPTDVHEDLKEQAQRVGEPATVLARKAIEERVRVLKREQIADEITAYARAVAGTVDDFDPAIAAAGLEVWAADDDDWREEDTVAVVEAPRTDPDAARIDPDAARIDPDAARIDPDAARIDPDAARIDPDAR